MFLRSFVLLLSFCVIAACKPSKARVIRGHVGGKVVDGQTGLPITGASVFSTSEKTSPATSDVAGEYMLTKLLAMRHLLQADMTGYISEQQSVFVPKEDTLYPKNFVLLPQAYAADKVIIVLTWGQYPTDLDSHLWVPDTPYNEVYYAQPGDLTVAPWASLDVDDVTSFGPETIAIKYVANTLDYPGIYRYYVHNYSQNPNDLTVSEAQVKVYLDGVLTKTYDVPGSGSGEYWHVFDMQAGVITDVNVLTATPVDHP